MTEQEITNWLIFGIGMAWFSKIGFHFIYLKAVDNSIKELNFISFYLNIENVFRSVLLVSPFFIARTGTEEQEIKRKKRKAKISAYALWTMFALTGFYLYHHSPKKETIQTPELADTNSVQAAQDQNERIENQEPLSPYQQELDKTLNDPTVDQYFKGIYNQEKLIFAEDSKMLSVPDSLTSKDPDNDLFYFIVFTKSMNGSDGFYSEAVGLAAFNYVTTQTEQFADYFNIAPKLTDKDMGNWANYIFGEIQISRENHELKAVGELEKQLIGNIKGARKEYKVVIEKLIEKIESIAHARGYNQAGG